jgi:hypothetical protein
MGGYPPTMQLGAPGIMPPVAPGVPSVAFASQMQSNLLANHASGLIDAGQAIYAHFGGDPSSATPADIATFHGQLQGAITGAASTPRTAAPAKKQSGGVVHGSPGPDQVPAMLTAGEYVMNKDAVNRIGVGNLNAMNRKKFADGGPVETRHAALSTSTSSSSPPAAPGATDSSSTASSAGGQGDLFGGISKAFQAYGMRMGSFGGPGSGAPGYAGTGYSPATTGLFSGDKLGYLGDEPITKEMGLNTGPGSGQPTASALGAIGSGLQQAGSQIASSVKPWQMQENAIGKFGSPVSSSAPAAQFAQQPTQNAPQQSNPYMMRYMMGLG